MYRTAKSLELVKVEVYGCFILCSYLFLHKLLSLIAQNFDFVQCYLKGVFLLLFIYLS